MKQVNQVMQQQLASLRAGTNQQPQQATQNQNIAQHHEWTKNNNSDASFINYAVEQLIAIFPAANNTLKTPQKLAEFKAAWTKALVEAGITTTKQIERGLRVARQHNSDFLPSCGRFITWCKPKPEDFGLLDFEQSYKQTCLLSTSDPAVLFVLQRLDNLTKFKLGTDEERRKTWAGAWQRLGDYLERGGKIPPLPPRQSLPPPTAADFKRNRRRIKQLMKLLAS